MKKDRKIFFVVASGGHNTDRHYYETIERKRTIEEAARFITSSETGQLQKYFHGRSYAVWGAVPGSGNSRTWETMEEGDYVMVYRGGKIILAAEIALKVRNPNLARFFWGQDSEGKTWEYIYFLINEVKVNVQQAELNKYLGYGEKYFPRGFMAIDQQKANRLLTLYGDLLSLLKRIEDGEKPKEIDIEKLKKINLLTEEKIEKAPTIHDEIQWRLIRIGNKAKYDVWVPRADQGKKYENQVFRDLVIPEFHEAIDIPSYITNIDTVWKLGYSIKAAFEIEHSTSIYSGILRLSDLRALAPNSSYPLFIVADRDRKINVFEQLERPTFSNDYLRLNKTVKFLSYDNVRSIDENLRKPESTFDIDWLINKGESPSNN